MGAKQPPWGDPSKPSWVCPKDCENCGQPDLMLQCSEHKPVLNNKFKDPGQYNMVNVCLDVEHMG